MGKLPLRDDDSEGRTPPAHALCRRRAAPTLMALCTPDSARMSPAEVARPLLAVSVELGSTPRTTTVFTATSGRVAPASPTAEQRCCPPRRLPPASNVMAAPSNTPLSFRLSRAIRSTRRFLLGRL